MLKDFLKDNTESILLQIESEDLTITDKKSGRSLLQIAVMNENIDVVKALVKQGVDLNYVNPKNGSTALLSALETNSLECVALLLQSKKCDVEYLVQEKSYWFYAVLWNSQKILELLHQYRVPLNINCHGSALHEAIKGNMIENAIYLINIGIDLSMVDEDGDTAIHLIAVQGNAELLNLIQQKKVNNILFNQLNKDGNAPIHLAAMNEQSLFINVLLRNEGVDQHKTNKAGMTYQMITDDIAKKKQMEKEQVELRKKQNAEERKDRQQQRTNEQLQKEQQEKEERRRLKEIQSMAAEVQQKQEKSQRFMMLGILGLVFVGFYLVLQFTITNKNSNIIDL